MLPMTFYFFLKLSIFREQMNFGTAYLDGSGIYGATPESADKLREFKRGFLKVIKSSWPTSRKSMKEAKSADFFN